MAIQKTTHSSNSHFYTCAECGKNDEKMKKCGRCRIERYCSVECQTKAWPTHKPVCVKTQPTFSPQLTPQSLNIPQVVSQMKSVSEQNKAKLDVQRLIDEAKALPLGEREQKFYDLAMQFIEMPEYVETAFQMMREHCSSQEHACTKFDENSLHLIRVFEIENFPVEIIDRARKKFFIDAVMYLLKDVSRLDFLFEQGEALGFQEHYIKYPITISLCMHGHFKEAYKHSSSLKKQISYLEATFSSFRAAEVSLRQGFVALALTPDQDIFKKGMDSYINSTDARYSQFSQAARDILKLFQEDKMKTSS